MLCLPSQLVGLWHWVSHIIKWNCVYFLSHNKHMCSAQTWYTLYGHLSQHRNPCIVYIYVYIYIYIWVYYNISLTWIKAIWGWFPLLTMIPVRENSEVVIIYPDLYIYIFKCGYNILYYSPLLTITNHYYIIYIYTILYRYIISKSTGHEKIIACTTGPLLEVAAFATPPVHKRWRVAAILA